MRRSAVSIIFGCLSIVAADGPRADARGNPGHDYHVVNRTGMDVELTTYYKTRKLNQLHYLRIGPVLCPAGGTATVSPPPADRCGAPIIVIAEEAGGRGWWRAYGEPTDTGNTTLTFKSQSYGGGPGGFANTIDAPTGSDQSIDITKQGFAPSGSAVPSVPKRKATRATVLDLDSHPFYKIAVVSKYPIGMKMRCALSTRKIAETPAFSDHWIGEQEVYPGGSCVFYSLNKPELRGGGRYLLRFRAQDFDNKTVEWFNPDGIAAQKMGNTLSLTLRK